MTDAASSTSELMDSIYRTQRHIYDLTRKYYLLGRDRLIRELAPPEDGCVLEVGCGTGRNLIKAARRYPRARFYGIDISEAMLEKARAEIMRAGFAHRIELARADAASFEAHSLFGRSDFDRVFFSYSLSMIPRWREALGQGFSVTGAGGRLLVVDFGMQQRLPAWFRRLLMWWLKQFHVAPRAELGAAIDTLGKGRTQELYGDYARIAEVVR